VAEPEEQNLPADGQSHAVQTTAPGEVLCGASPHSAGADKVRTTYTNTCRSSKIENAHNLKKLWLRAFHRRLCVEMFLDFRSKQCKMSEKRQ